MINGRWIVVVDINGGWSMIPGGYSGGGGMEMTYRVISIKYGISVFIVRWRIVILKVENARYSWIHNICLL